MDWRRIRVEEKKLLCKLLQHIAWEKMMAWTWMVATEIEMSR